MLCQDIRTELSTLTLPRMQMRELEDFQFSAHISQHLETEFGIVRNADWRTLSLEMTGCMRNTILAPIPMESRGTRSTIRVVAMLTWCLKFPGGPNVPSEGCHGDDVCARVCVLRYVNGICEDMRVSFHPCIHRDEYGHHRRAYMYQ
ncbi:hypothetical protein BDN71DRAFT_1452629 [Pleurotus eryngii]|uniref:Uncharacterized protein n=1 Tax=Pleurotus eryngii TaxID=5323 RepID=A0A9P5ZTW0_PLEER|nr:hypothetical protein BDN71DRAFT_1452629 [Pleurotus eryngii]